MGLFARQHRLESQPVHGARPILAQGFLVGLPDAAVRESRQRIRAAISNARFRFPIHRVTVNLAPADLKKAGKL